MEKKMYNFKKVPFITYFMYQKLILYKLWVGINRIALLRKHKGKLNNEPLFTLFVLFLPLVRVKKLNSRDFSFSRQLWAPYRLPESELLDTCRSAAACLLSFWLLSSSCQKIQAASLLDVICTTLMNDDPETDRWTFFFPWTTFYQQQGKFLT